MNLVFRHYGASFSVGLPLSNGLLELLVVGMRVAPRRVERTVPEMVGHQSNVPLLMPDACARTVSAANAPP